MICRRECFRNCERDYKRKCEEHFFNNLSDTLGDRDLHPQHSSWVGQIRLLTSLVVCLVCGRLSGPPLAMCSFVPTSHLLSALCCHCGTVKGPLELLSTPQ